jgi:arabinosaccharide transport system substrate-binding protein
MSFHLGKPILILTVLAVVSGLAVLSRRPPAAADLTVWTFADDNAQAYTQPALDGEPSLIETFRRQAGLSVSVQVINQHALDARLISLFMSPGTGRRPPDLVEIDLASVGKYFRAPVSDIGLLPLNGFLEESGELKKILPSRLATWSKNGVIFGVPRDVHPITLTYRADLFDQAGVNLEAARTWPEFQEKCLQFQRYWSDHGFPNRAAMELVAGPSEELLLMLLQRHINIVDEQNHIYLNDPKAAQTVAFYAQLVAGPRRIAAQSLPGTPFPYRDLADGKLCSMITPDWRTGYLKQYAPDLWGKVRMCPLPVFDPGDAPTSTWGGTMMGIPRNAINPRASWKLLELLCLSRQALSQRFRYSPILPPVREFWSDPLYQTGDPFFGGQAIDRLYIRLADRIPSRCVTPFSLTAQAALTMVMNKAVAYVNDHGGGDGLEAACAGWLAEATAELKHWVRQGSLDS